MMRPYRECVCLWRDNIGNDLRKVSCEDEWYEMAKYKVWRHEFVKMLIDFLSKGIQAHRKKSLNQERKEE